MVVILFSGLDTVQGQEYDQTREMQNERALLMMIQQLRTEVADLRRQVANQDRPALPNETGSRNCPRTDRCDGACEDVRDRATDPRLSTDPLMKQGTRIFAVYNKNLDQRVSFEEWLAMREGEMTSERRSREMGFFSQQSGDDRRITLKELYRVMVAKTRAESPREGE